MARVKRALNAHKKRRTVLKASKGYRGQRSRLYRKAKERPGIHTFIATSDLHLEHKLNMSRQEVIDAAVWAVERAKISEALIMRVTL